MGLSGRKTKQRIPNDPRNLTWANDANKFGAAYLAKLGWDPSRGLGVSGEGRTTALTVNQKLDMLGIGADHKNSAEGIAWKQNKDFENLLRRLNAANGEGEAEEEPMKIDGFVRANDGKDKAPSTEDEKDEVAEDVEQVNERKTKKKRKKGEEEEDDGRKKKRKKSKSSENVSDDEEVSKKEKKKKKKRDATDEVVSLSEAVTASPSPVPASTPAPPSRHPRAAFRGRHMAAKSLASKSASAISEILGISPTPSTSVSAYPSSAPTPYPSTPYEPGPSDSSSSDPSGSATPAEEIKLQELSVSSKSVMDYFKEKLAAKSNARVFVPSPTSLPSTPAAEEDEYDERPRMGLGSSKLRMEVARASEAETAEVEERRGLGGIGSGMRSSFAAMFISATSTRTNIQADVETPAHVADGMDEDEDEEPSKKPKKDKEKKKSKKDKGKSKATDAVADAPVTLAEDAADDKAERKRRKEEKRRRKEAEAQAIAVSPVDEGDVVSDGEVKERKRKKDKKKAKAES